MSVIYGLSAQMVNSVDGLTALNCPTRQSRLFALFLSSTSSPRTAGLVLNKIPAAFSVWEERGGRLGLRLPSVRMTQKVVTHRCKSMRLMPLFLVSLFSLSCSSTMMRSPGLNPSSTPFFPGGAATGRDEVGSGFHKQAAIRMDADRASTASSSLSISPSDFRSVRSSPSPPQEDTNGGDKDSPTMFRRSPTLSTEGSRGSPSIRAFDAGKSYPNVEMRSGREHSLAANLEFEGSLESETTSAATDNGSTTGGTRQIRESFFPAGVLASARERLATPPVSCDPEPFRSTIVTNNIYAPNASSSPSSLDSAGFSTAVMDQFTFDAQLKTSPLINDIVRRLIRYENNLVEIKRNLDEVNRKVDSLLDQPTMNHAPEFNDPFSPGNIATLNGSRPSLALPHQLPSNSIAPNQIPTLNGSATDEVGQISQRLNVLTSSVGQLLALQTQQIQATSASLPTASSLSGIPPDVITQPIGPSLSQHMLGNGLPSTRSELRNSPRHPPQPMRTWSAGSLDLPARGTTDSSAAATTRQDTLLRDKRRSTVALLRRDSLGVCFHLSRLI